MINEQQSTVYDKCTAMYIVQLMINIQQCTVYDK